jgi:hypothetical protein
MNKRKNRSCHASTKRLIRRLDSPRSQTPGVDLYPNPGNFGIKKTYIQRSPKELESKKKED